MSPGRPLTQQEWLTCQDPHLLLGFYPIPPGERKLRLLALACLQRIQHLLCKQSRKALRFAVRRADGLIIESEWRALYNRARNASFDRTDRARLAAEYVAYNAFDSPARLQNVIDYVVRDARKAASLE